jgi:hypothetical protein
MASHSKPTAHEVHELLLEAHPHTDDTNLTKAAHTAETAGVPRDKLQLETFVAIRNLRTAIEKGASAAEAEALLLHAVDVAERWVEHATK